MWFEALIGSHTFNVLLLIGWFISVKNSNVSYYFLNIIHGNDFSQQELIEKLLASVLMYYVNMGASQFLRDFRRECYIQKSVELRKRVLQRKERTKEKSDCVPFQVFLLIHFLKTLYNGNNKELINFKLNVYVNTNATRIVEKMHFFNIILHEKS